MWRMSPSFLLPRISSSVLRAFVLPLLLLAAVAGGCRKADKVAATPAPTAAKPTHAIIETDKGTIEIEFLTDAAPKTVENFTLLAQRGYYDGLKFHRIVKGFMLQGGDPMGTGIGGESAWGGTFNDEIVRGSELYRTGYRRGLVAMANSGPNTNTSQFFIMHQDYVLQPDYTIFGRVSKGMEVVDALALSPTRRGPDGGMSWPIEPVIMKKVTVK